MTGIAWAFIIIGALINFLAKPVLEKYKKRQESMENTVYVVKIIGMLLVIAGAAMIFVAGGRVDVGAIR